MYMELSTVYVLSICISTCTCAGIYLYVHEGLGWSSCETNFDCTNTKALYSHTHSALPLTKQLYVYIVHEVRQCMHVHVHCTCKALILVYMYMYVCMCMCMCMCMYIECTTTHKTTVTVM